MLEKLNLFLLIGLITLVLLMWKLMGLLLKKNRLLRYWNCLSILNWTKALTLSRLPRLPPTKIGALPCCMKFLSPKTACCLYKSTILPWLEYCCHTSAGAASCYFDMLDKVQKSICRAVDPCYVSWTLCPLTKCRQLRFFL